MNAVRELADELDAVGLRPMGTNMLHEAQEILSMKVAALQRLQRENDNAINQGTHDEVITMAARQATDVG